MEKECKLCKKTFEVDSKSKRKQFCNLSCAVTFNNQQRGPLNENHKNKISSSLKNKRSNSPNLFPSGIEHSKSVGKTTKGKYNGENVKSILDLSKRTTSKILKRIGVQCSNCGWDKTTCDIHHIKGRKIPDCDNHSNLCLLCPNCHRLVHEGKLQICELKTLDEIIPENWRDYYYG